MNSRRTFMHRRSRALGAVAFCAALTTWGCGMKVVPNEVFGATPGVVVEGDGFTIQENQPISLPFVVGPESVRQDLVNDYEHFRDKGARDVRVRVPGLEMPLYGLISLHELPPDSRGAARRSLRVSVPERYIAAASDGRVSVVFEPVATDGDDYLGWVLWLSDRPF